jgi:hypothetical protein
MYTKFKFHSNPTRIMGTLHDIPTFVAISRRILLRMGNVLDESCGEKQNTRFEFSSYIPKIVLFMR